MSPDCQETEPEIETTAETDFDESRSETCRRRLQRLDAVARSRSGEAN